MFFLSSMVVCKLAEKVILFYKWSGSILLPGAVPYSALSNSLLILGTCEMKIMLFLLKQKLLKSL